MKMKIGLTFSLLFCLLFTTGNTITGQDSAKVGVLYDYAKLYGLIRFYHPSDQSADANWNLFSIHSIEKILRQDFIKKNSDSFILSLFDSIAPSILNKSFANISTGKIKIWNHKGYGMQQDKSYKSHRILLELDSANLKERNYFHEHQLNTGLKISIPLYALVDINGRTLPNFNIQKQFSYIENSNSHSIAISLANFIHTWNVLRHFFPYQNEINLNWDKLLFQNIHRSLSDTSIELHYYTLQRFLSLFKDGHMGVYHKSMNKNFAIPISFKMIDQKIYIEKMLSPIPGLSIGDEIIKVNNQKISAYVAEMRSRISGSPQWVNFLISKEISRGMRGYSTLLELRTGRKINLHYTLHYFNYLWFFKRDDTIQSKEISQEVLYVNLNYLPTDSLIAKIETMRKYKGIIFDLRGYPLPNLRSFLPYLEIENDSNWMMRADSIQPYFKSYKPIFLQWNLPKVTNPLKNIHVLLIDGRSISYAESVSLLFKTYGKSNYVIGTPSAGANGNINRVDLLNGFSFTFTGLKVTFPDSFQHFIYGVKPDVLVKEKSIYLKQGRDIFIETAIKLIDEK